MSPSAFDSMQLRRALGAFATGVTVITGVGVDGARAGVTANSFNSVSLDPPLVLWSLSRKSTGLPVFESALHWTVHVLASSQEQVANHFAKSGGDKFAGLTTTSGIAGVPLLPGCAARFQCRTASRHEGGDHLILLGEVLEFEHEDLEPLVFHGGNYAVPMRKAQASSV